MSLKYETIFLLLQSLTHEQIPLRRSFALYMYVERARVCVFLARILSRDEGRGYRASERPLEVLNGKKSLPWRSLACRDGAKRSLQTEPLWPRNATPIPHTCQSKQALPRLFSLADAGLRYCGLSLFGSAGD